MSEGYALMLSLTIYKGITLLTGLALAFMGYKLFVHGIFTDSGELRTNWEDKKLVLRKAAPGTFFALFGTIIVCVSLWRGLSFEPSKTAPVSASPGSSPEHPQAQGLSGSALFESAAGGSLTPATEKTRQQVLNDVAALNRIESKLVPRSQPGTAPGKGLTVTAEETDRILDLISGTKTRLMLSVWSPAWGDPEEFGKWAAHVPGYSYGDPPTGIARAAAIFKGAAP
jgi:hypothetical protein